jgi:hypothetical protein
MGFTEFLVVAVIGVVWVVPILAAVWALLTLKQLRDGQRAVEGKLDTIAHMLQR